MTSCRPPTLTFQIEPTRMLLPFSASILVLLILHLPTGLTSISTHEVDTMLSTLHSRGPYNLIANAIATSDLRFDILDSSSFTLFAPPDSSLFSFALTLPSSAYVSALRFHSSPHRYSSSDLHRLVSSSSAPAIPTLLTPRSLQIRTTGTLLALNNVEVSFPGIFYSHNIAVHGISEKISLRNEHPISPTPSLASFPAMYDRSRGHRHFFRIQRFGNRTDHSLENHGEDVASPVGFTPVPAPAPFPKKTVFSIGLAPVPAPAPMRIDEANSKVPRNVMSSTAITAATKGIKADPVDTDTLDEVYIWNGGDVDSLFDEFL